MPKRHIYLLVGLFFLVQFVIFSHLVHKNVFTTLDFNTTVRLQDHTSDRLINEFSILSEVGKFEIVTFTLVMIFVIIRRLKAGIAALGFYVVFHLIEIFGKYFVDHPPPPEFMLKTEQLISMPHFHVRSEFSYPSGHSGRALFISIIILTIVWQSKRFSMPVKLLFTGLVIGYDGAMLISRVYLGEHWTTDVVGGILLGVACGFFAGMFLLKKGTKGKKSFFPKYKVEMKRID